MTFAAVIVEVGFSSPSTGTYLHLGDAQRGILGTATLAPVDLWVDVSEWVTSVSTRRGATRADGPVLRYESGTATIVLRNEDRRFDPTNLDGPYVASGVTQVEPMRAVRIRATWDGVTDPLWRGFADDWIVSYDGPNTSVVTLVCSDAFSVFASYDRDAIAAVGSGEDSGARIDRILDSIDWPAEDRMIAVGDVTLQSTVLADNTLAELLLTADSELGEFWMDPQGRAVFRNRLAIQEETRSALPQATFGDDPHDGVTTAINHWPNPSVEVSDSGFQAAGTPLPTVARTSTRAHSGTWAIEVTWAGGFTFLPSLWAVHSGAGLVVGRTYTWSAWVYVPTGSPTVVLFEPSVSFGQAVTVKDTWTRVAHTFTHNGGEAVLAIHAADAGGDAGDKMFLDDVMVTEGTSVPDYFDGDSGNSEWDGVAHASTSRRLPELPYADLTITSDRQSMANLISIANNGGTAQVVEDPGSRTAYLTRTYQRHDLLMQTDAAALVYGEQLLARTSIPEQRPSQVVLNPRRDADRLYPQALGREIGDRVRIVRRPPGGGDAIERDVWVRGIQHDIVRDRTWRTTFALQKAPVITTVTDPFARAVSGNWGTAPSGHVWSGADAAYSTTGTKGRHSVSAVASTFATLIDGLVVAGIDCSVRCVVASLATGAAITWGLYGRYVDGSNFYLARVALNTDQTVTLTVSKTVDGSTTTLGTYNHPSEQHTATDNFSLRFVLTGTTLRAKVLGSAADPIPNGWMVEATDAALAAGTVGCRSRLDTGNTNTLPVNVDYDDFTATSLYAWA